MNGPLSFFLIKPRKGINIIERIEQEVRSILADFGQGSGHVFNLGHGIHQDVPESAPKIFVDAIHEFSKAYHK